MSSGVVSAMEGHTIDFQSEPAHPDYKCSEGQQGMLKFLRSCLKKFKIIILYKIKKRMN